ncbi:MAG: signal peptidase I [Desulfuromonas sp.]|nr:MAG: signal peptidase I [Desulfuromonas sp.]
MFKKKTKEPAGPPKPWYREWSEALIIAVVLALIIRTLLFQAFKIPSGSMEDTLLIGDHLLVNKFIYGTDLPFTDNRILKLRDPQRGDVIVFEYPPDTANPDLNFWQKRDFIKRVIGLPGDTVEINDKHVFVNGDAYEIPQAVFKDSYLRGASPMCVFPFGENTACRDFMPKITVPEGTYFVMGDNRDRSFDSRYWGFVPRDNIKGLAFIKYWSWDGEADLLHKIRFDRIGRPIH